MKKLKLNFSAKSEVLNREQLKKVLGGSIASGSGDCVGWHGSCDTSRALNCCNGYHCASFVCRTATV